MDLRAGILWKVVRVGAGLLALAALTGPVRGSWIWVEGERPTRATVQRHPPWYDKVKRDQFSGGDFLSHWADRPGEASYRVRATEAGPYTLWVRANPVKSRLSYRLGGGPWTPIATDGPQRDAANVAADGKLDLRFLAWIDAGRVTLAKGDNVLQFRMHSDDHNHGYLDCFVLTDEPFQPRGALKPDQLAAADREASAAEAGWFAFGPGPDRFSATSGFDLRGLNEPEAGRGGFIGVKDSDFVHTATGQAVRFWGVNGPASQDRDGLRREARMLAKRGVNLVRIHHAVFDEKGEVDRAAVLRALEAVEALKAEGIYTHFSIYFPLWLKPAPDTPWLRGYDGNQHPFAALFFNEDFQATYRAWWTALLTTPSPTTGRGLVDDPAVMGLEVLNEDSYLFWTFTDKNLPEPQLRMLESRFGAWCGKKYGSIDEALRAWGGGRLGRDDPSAGRLAFRPLWNLAHERTARDRDTARFLVESQRAFYEETYRFLRGLGFRGVITASNWTTASPEVLGPLEKYTYTAGDFLDRHGYFGCRHRGENAAWSIREGHTYVDRSALRFDPEEPGKPRVFAHPAFDPSYDGKPSMISETTWTRPNRYRSEAPLFYACYGALQGSDAVVHFALDGASWSVKPRFFMQPWTLMSPAMIGQFPAAALIYRRGLVAEGETLVQLDLKLGDLLDLKGTPLPQDAALDELRAKDVPRGTTLKPGEVIDPLVHLAGRADVRFTERGGPPRLADLSRLIDRDRKVVTSSNGQLRLDYGKGLLAIDAPAAQGISGALREAGTVELADLTVSSGLELGHVVAVSLDGRPLASSRKVLVQAMSEERPSGFRTEPAGDRERRITSLGRDPWMVRNLEGLLRFKRPDAPRLKVTALDPNGEPVREVGRASEFRLAPDAIYYLIAP